MLQINPLTSLALSIQANPGVYALLVGSGISRDAGIPTGWMVTLDLIKRVAVAEGEDTAGNPEGWFKRKFNKDPDYSDLLDRLFDQGTRQAALRGYFEPNAEEREDGKTKVPTLAHKAIARLVRDKYVRVIVTPNFDHLLEDALRVEGVEPVVVSTPDGADGAPPLDHASCLILKVHGDYLDARIKNTKAELEQYDDKVNLLLDRIFNNYGLIVCGWSAEWDAALRAAIERTPNRRYGMYWTAQSAPTGAAKKLIDLRSAKFITIDSADAFFGLLADNVEALAKSMQPNPMDVQAAVAMVKRFLAEERHRIRLHDLMEAEARATNKRLNELESSALPGNVREQVELREEASEIILRMLAAGGFYSRGDQAKLLRRCAEIIVAGCGSVQAGWLSLYVPILAVYVPALTAIAGGNESIVGELIAAELLKTERGSSNRRRRILYPFCTRLEEALEALPDNKGQHTPLSNSLFTVCRRLTVSYFVDEAAYDRHFDRFEYIAALLAYKDEERLMPGRWTWNAALQKRQGLPDVYQQLDDEIASSGESWPYLAAFGGTVDRLREARAAFDARARECATKMNR